jgi:hypothetical protein
VAGLIADAAGFSAAIVTVAVLKGVSGLLVAVRLRETMHRLSSFSTATIRKLTSQRREP